MPLINSSVSDIDRKIDTAIEFVNVRTLRKFSKSLTKNQLESIPEMANCNFGWVVACVISVVDLENVKIIMKKSRNPFTSAKAWTYGKDIYFNSRKNHTLESMIKTICHELVHIADSKDELNFGHGSNFNQDQKQLTAPMLFASLFYDYIEARIVEK